MSIDATRPYDRDPVVDWPGYIRDIAAQVLLNEAAIGGDFTRTISDITITSVIASDALNQVYRVNSSSNITVVLPQLTASLVGKWVRLYKWGAGNVTITAGGVDTIANSGGPGNAINSSPGEAKVAMLDLEGVATGEWAVVGMFGSWDIS